MNPQIIKLTIAATILASPAFAQDHGAGNGGTVLVCNGETQIEALRNRTMLADFAETIILPGLRKQIAIVDTNDVSVEKQIDDALLKIRPLNGSLYEELRNEVYKIKNSAKATEGYSWHIPNDLGDFPMPLPDKSCELKNSVNYRTEEYIEKNATLIQDMRSNTQEAGLWVHEGVFKLTRKYANTKTSLAARRITALLFTKGQTPLLNSLMAIYLKNDESDKVNRSAMSIYYKLKSVGGIITVSVLVPCKDHYTSILADGNRYETEVNTGPSAHAYPRAMTVSARYRIAIFGSNGKCNPLIQIGDRYIAPFNAGSHYVLKLEASDVDDSVLDARERVPAASTVERFLLGY